MSLPLLIYCAAGNPRLAEIAIHYGFTYGAQLPNKHYYPPEFVDQDWKAPNRAAYMAALAEYRPRLATVLDWEREDQLDEVISWAWEAARYVKEAVIIIPKVMDRIDCLPPTIAGKEVRLGYSVPTKFGATSLPQWQFGCRPVHLLGGSPKHQLELAQYMNVKSADGNYAQKMAVNYAQFFAPGTAKAKDRYWPRLKELVGFQDDAPYHAWTLSCINIQAAWKGCTATIRYATEADIPAIVRIIRAYEAELGRPFIGALRKAVVEHRLFVAEYQEIVGFVHLYQRKDGGSTIYEIAVKRDWWGKRIATGLLCAVPRPIRLKCTTDNPANGFYERSGFQLTATEAGRKRALNVWTLE